MNDKPQKRPRNSRSELQLETRGRLVQATIEVISGKGYQCATIDHITAHAGTGRATFYLHFRSKPEALMAGWRELYTPLTLSLLLELDHAYPVSKDFMQQWVDRFMTLWERNKAIALASQEAISLEPALAKAWYQEIWNVSTELPNWAQRNSDDTDAPHRLFMIGAFTDRVLTLWVANFTPSTREQIGESLMERWLTEFGADAGGVPLTTQA